MYRWTGTDWQPIPLQIPAGTPAVNPTFSAYEVTRQRLRVVCNPGTIPNNNAFELWELVDVSLTASEPYPRPGESTQLQIALPAAPRQAWWLGLSLGSGPGSPLRTVPGVGWEVLPLQVDALLLASLSVPIGGVLDGTGRGTVSLGIPANPWLAGVQLHSAAFTMQPGLTVGAITSAQPLWIVQ